jgi:glycosyltransferase involved in cell wall biosynthesis
MSAALWERAGIPQVARQMTWILSKEPGLATSALFLSIHWGSVADRYRRKKKPPVSVLEDAEYLADALDSQGKARFEPFRFVRQFLKPFTGGSYPLIQIEPGQFNEVIWENYFAPGLPSPCRGLLERTRFYRSPLAWREVTTRLRLRLSPPCLKTSEFDFVIFQNPSSIGVSPGTVKIIRCHDLVPLFRFDTQPPSQHLIRDYYRTLSLCARDSYFACVSDSTRDELVSLYPDLKPRAFVVPNSVALPLWSGERKRIETADKYFLTVGTIEPRKNYSRLFDAFRIYQRTQPDPIRLVMVGNAGWHNEAELREIKQAVKSGWLTWHKRVAPDRLIDLYQDAYALISASVHEGFGFPPLEAAALGTPSILSDLPIFREHLGDAAEYFDPYSSLSMAQAFSRLDAPRRAELATASEEKSRRFRPENEAGDWRELFARLSREGRGAA